MPDFSFTHGGKTAHLEIIGYWSPRRLGAHLTALEELGPQNVVVAVSRKLNGSNEVLAAHPNVPVIDYAEVIPAKRVLEAIEGVAVPEP
jgi:predicted nuclease of restriction endonuclease-like RecB superfamily